MSFLGRFLRILRLLITACRLISVVWCLLSISMAFSYHWFWCSWGRSTRFFVSGGFTDDGGAEPLTAVDETADRGTVMGAWGTVL